MSPQAYRKKIVDEALIWYAVKTIEPREGLYAEDVSLAKAVRRYLKECHAKMPPLAKKRKK